MNGNLMILLLLGAAAFLIFGGKGQAWNEKVNLPGAATDSSTSDAIRSRGTLQYVASGWTPGFDGTPGTCPPNAMC